MNGRDEERKEEEETEAIKTLETKMCLERESGRERESVCVCVCALKLFLDKDFELLVSSDS
jgi:hypothetical protein